MQLHIPRSETLKIIETLKLLSSVFPDATGDLAEVNRVSRHGVTVEVKPLKTKRTRPQENYYRKYCGMFAKFCGMTPDEMHDEILCQCYGSEECETKFGVKRRPVKRSSDATRGDYSELIETLCRVAAQMDYHIPSPEISYEQARLEKQKK